MTGPPTGGMPDRRAKKPRPDDGGLRASDPEGIRFLLGRSTDDLERSRRKGKNFLRFKIQHIMYLTAWTAMLLAIRQPLQDSVPELVRAMVWASGIGGVAMTAGVYGIALLMEEGPYKDKLVRRVLYFLCADMLLFFIFTILDKKN